MNDNVNVVKRLKAHFDRMQKQLPYGFNVVSLHKRPAQRATGYTDAKKCVKHDFVRLFQLSKYSFGFLFNYENVEIPVVEVTVMSIYSSDKTPLKTSGKMTIAEFKDRMRLLNQSLELFNQSVKKIRMGEVEFLSLFSKYLIDETADQDISDDQIKEIKKEYKQQTLLLSQQLKNAQSEHTAGMIDEDKAKLEVFDAIDNCAETKRIHEIEALITELTKEKKKLVETVNDLKSSKQKDLQLKQLNIQNTKKEKEVLALEEAIKKTKFDFLWQYPIDVIKRIDSTILKK